METKLSLNELLKWLSQKRKSVCTAEVVSFALSHYVGCYDRHLRKLRESGWLVSELKKNSEGVLMAYWKQSPRVKYDSKRRSYYLGVKK